MVDPRIKTARSSGAIGARAKVPRIALSMVKPGDSVLDFGCGPQFIHQDMFLEKGIECYGHDLAWADIGVDGYRLGAYSISDPPRQFKVVFASNVLNVQETADQLRDTLGGLAQAAGWVGNQGTTTPILWNYPGSPRKLGWPVEKLLDFIQKEWCNAATRRIEAGVYLSTPITPRSRKQK